MKCSYCGRENEDKASFCGECGSELGPPPLGTRDALAPMLGWVKANRESIKVGVSVLAAGLVIYLVSAYLHRPHLSKEEVIQIANTAAVADGFLLDEYRAPEALLGPATVKRSWEVIYSQKIASPWERPLPKPQSAHGAPAHFCVFVEDKTGRTQLGILQETGSGHVVSPPPGVTILKYYTNPGPRGPVARP